MVESLRNSLQKIRHKKLGSSAGSLYCESVVKYYRCNDGSRPRSQWELGGGGAVLQNSKKYDVLYYFPRAVRVFTRLARSRRTV